MSEKTIYLKSTFYGQPVAEGLQEAMNQLLTPENVESLRKKGGRLEVNVYAPPVHGYVHSVAHVHFEVSQFPHNQDVASVTLRVLPSQTRTGIAIKEDVWRQLTLSARGIDPVRCAYAGDGSYAVAHLTVPMPLLVGSQPVTVSCRGNSVSMIEV